MAGYRDMNNEQLMAELGRANRRLTTEAAIASRFNARRGLESARVPILKEAYKRDLIGYPPKRKWRIV
jgi:hypothetical protein